MIGLSYASLAIVVSASVSLFEVAADPDTLRYFWFRAFGFFLSIDTCVGNKQLIGKESTQTHMRSRLHLAQQISKTCFQDNQPKSLQHILSIGIHFFVFGHKARV